MRDYSTLIFDINVIEGTTLLLLFCILQSTISKPHTICIDATLVIICHFNTMKGKQMTSIQSQIDKRLTSVQLDVYMLHEYLSAQLGV